MIWNLQRNVLGKGNGAEIGRGNEEDGEVEQLAAPENEGVFGAEFIKCHIPDTSIVAAGMVREKGGRGGVASGGGCAEREGAVWRLLW